MYIISKHSFHCLCLKINLINIDVLSINIIINIASCIIIMPVIHQSAGMRKGEGIIDDHVENSYSRQVLSTSSLKKGKFVCQK